MTFWLANRLQKQGGWMPGLTMLTRPGSAMQGIIAGTVVGLVLGIYHSARMAVLKVQRSLPIAARPCLHGRHNWADDPAVLRFVS